MWGGLVGADLVGEPPAGEVVEEPLGGEELAQDRAAGEAGIADDAEDEVVGAQALQRRADLRRQSQFDPAADAEERLRHGLARRRLEAQRLHQPLRPFRGGDVHAFGPGLFAAADHLGDVPRQVVGVQLQPGRLAGGKDRRMARVPHRPRDRFDRDRVPEVEGDRSDRHRAAG